MARLFITKNLKSITADSTVEDLAGRLDSILNDIETQTNDSSAIYSLVNPNSEEPRGMRTGDCLLDIRTNELIVSIYNGATWQSVSFGALPGSITADQHGALGRLTTTTAQPLHTVATSTENGFMVAADKTKLDGIASSATNTPLSSASPVTIAPGDTASAGASTSASRADHRHAAPPMATTSLDGFMSAADKVKSDHIKGITTSAADPTTTEYPATGDYGLHLNTTSGLRYWAINDGGVIFKTLMA